MKELARLFLRLGTVAFGGPAAHIAMMEREVVQRRGWVTHEYFLDLLSATNLIPGPNSTEMALHIGYVRSGWRGLVVAGACFIAPAVAITLALAMLYERYGTLESLRPLVHGLQPAVIAIILGAVYRLSRPLRTSPFALLVVLATAALSLVGVNEVALLLGAGLAGMLWKVREKLGRTVSSWALLAPFLAAAPSVASVAAPASLDGIAWFFLRTGSVLYGSGYVLIAFLHGGLVEHRQWLTSSQLLDAIAIGQLTPGPVLTTATFIGYQLLGWQGALVATAAIFAPSFVFVLASNPLVPRLRRSALAGGFLDGVNPAALGLMLAAAITISQAALTGLSSWVLLVVALALTAVWNLNTVWVVLASGALAWAFSFLTP